MTSIPSLPCYGPNPVLKVLYALMTLLLVLLCSQFAQADTLLRFRDGSANVWDNISDRGRQYCTTKAFGELCVPKSDVVLKKEVPAGTDPLEYGGTVTGGLQALSDNVYVGRNDQPVASSRSAEKKAEKARDQQKLDDARSRLDNTWSTLSGR